MVFLYDGRMAEEGLSAAVELELLCDERDRAIEMLRLIEEEGWTHHEMRGDDIMRDVTRKRANRQRQIIERMDRLIAAYERRQPR